MSDKKESLAKQQAKTKPTTESIIVSHLSSNEQKNALAFLIACKINKVSYLWSSTNRWQMKAKGKSIGWIDIGGERKGNAERSWYIEIDMRELRQYEDAIKKAGVSELVMNHFKLCNDCGSCSPGMKIKIFGKEFSNVCYGMPLYICNPDNDTIESVLKLIQMRLAIPRGTAARPLYDLITEGLIRIDNKHVIGVMDPEGNTDANMNFLFDGKYDRYYYAGPYGEFKSKRTSHDIIFELDKPTELLMYGFVTSMRTDAPQKWALYGKLSVNDSWNKLDEYKEFPKPITSYTEKAFKISNPVTYKYYRITLEGWIFMLSQIHLYYSKED